MGNSFKPIKRWNIPMSNHFMVICYTRFDFCCFIFIKGTVEGLFPLWKKPDRTLSIIIQCFFHGHIHLLRCRLLLDQVNMYSYSREQVYDFEAHAPSISSNSFFKFITAICKIKKIRREGISLTETTSAEQTIVLVDSAMEKPEQITEPATEKLEQITAKPAENEVSKENIAPRKTIVYATVVDDAAIREASNRIKQQLFTKFGFLKPKPEEVKFVSIEKYYQLYNAVYGKYAIDYYRKSAYSIPVDATVREVILLDNQFLPEHQASITAKPNIKLEGEEHIIMENQVFLVLNSEGKEVNSNMLCYAPSEKFPQEIIAEFGLKELAQNLDVDFIKERIVKRPKDINRIVSETFEVSERTAVYYPIYRVKFANSNTGQEKTVEFDGITSKILRQ